MIYFSVTSTSTGSSLEMLCVCVCGNCLLRGLVLSHVTTFNVHSHLHMGQGLPLIKAKEHIALWEGGWGDALWEGAGEVLCGRGLGRCSHWNV